MHHNTRIGVVGLAAGLALSLLTGCGVLGSDMSDKPTITQQQAIDRIDRLFDATGEAVRPKPRLVPFEGTAPARRCSNPTDGGSEDRIIVSRRFWLEDMPKGRNAEVARQIKAYWEGQGHTITKVEDLDSDQPHVFMRTRPDDFAVSLESSTDGALSFAASSPCIWQNGTPGETPTLY